MGRSRFECGEAILPLHFGTANLFLLIGEELLKVQLFFGLSDELFERSRLL